MTKTQFKKAIMQIVESIKENGDFDLLKSYVDPEGLMTEEEAFKHSVEEFSSKEVFDYVQENYLTIPSEYSFGEIEFDNVKYSILGTDNKISLYDGTMHYLYVDQYCITSDGDLFRMNNLEIRNDQLLYDNTLILQIEFYDSVNSDWYFLLDSLTTCKESPLYERYNGFLAC